MEDLLTCDDCGDEVDGAKTQQIKFMLGEEVMFDVRVCDECASRLEVKFTELKDEPI